MTVEGRARRVAPLIILSFFFAFLGPAVVQVFLKNLLPAGWSPVKITSILAVLYFSFMSWRVLIVHAQRAIGDKLSFILGLTSYLLIPVALVFTDNYAVLLVTAAVWGWGASAIWQTGPVWLYDNTGASHRGFWAGLIYTAVYAGLFAGTLLVGLASRRAGTGLMLAFLIAPGAVSVAIAAFLPARRARAEGLSFAAVRSMLVDRRVVIIGVLLFVSGASYGLLLGAFRDKIDARFGSLAVGQVVGVFFVTRLVISIAGGHFSDLFARRSVVALAFFLGGAGLAAAARLDNLPSLYVASVCLGLVGAVVPVSATAYSADWFPAEKRTLAMGSAFLWNDAATAISLLAGQYIVQASGGFGASMLIFGVLFLAATALSLLIPETRRADAEAI